MCQLCAGSATYHARVSWVNRGQMIGTGGVRAKKAKVSQNSHRFERNSSARQQSVSRGVMKNTWGSTPRCPHRPGDSGSGHRALPSNATVSTPETRGVSQSLMSSLHLSTFSLPNQHPDSREHTLETHLAAITGSVSTLGSNRISTLHESAPKPQEHE